MPYVTYFIATAVAPSAFRSTQYQTTQYSNQLAKYVYNANYSYHIPEYVFGGHFNLAVWRNA